MAKKETEEAKTAMELLTMDFQREDLNLLRDKINEIINKLN